MKSAGIAAEHAPNLRLSQGRPGPLGYILHSKFNNVNCQGVDGPFYLIEYCPGNAIRFATIYLIEADWRIYASVKLPSLVQIMACGLNGAKPLSKPMIEYC